MSPSLDGRPSRNRHQAHILAMNDNQAVLALFREVLEDEDYRVSTQTYIDHDLEAIKAAAPDLIVLDYMWATEDASWSLLQMLRMDRETAAIPIVLCTGAAREVEALSGHLEDMGVRVVLKPFNIDQLAAVIAESLAATGVPSPTDG